MPFINLWVNLTNIFRYTVEQVLNLFYGTISCKTYKIELKQAKNHYK